MLVRNSDVWGTFSLNLKMIAISSMETLTSLELTTDPQELVKVVFCNNFRIAVVSQSNSTTFLQYFDFLKPLKQRLKDIRVE